MADTAPRNRRIDRVTATDYLSKLAETPVSEVRTMRDDCREEEGRLSYIRRLLQGRLDIARAELTRRAGGQDAPDLLEVLPAILADTPTPSRRAAGSAPLYEPELRDRRADDLLTGNASLGRLPEMSDSELGDLVIGLADEERSISALRRVCLDHLDRLQAELIRRYRDGGIGDVVAALSESG